MQIEKSSLLFYSKRQLPTTSITTALFLEDTVWAWNQEACAALAPHYTDTDQTEGFTVCAPVTFYYMSHKMFFLLLIWMSQAMQLKMLSHQFILHSFMHKSLRDSDSQSADMKEVQSSHIKAISMDSCLSYSLALC